MERGHFLHESSPAFLVRERALPKKDGRIEENGSGVWKYEEAFVLHFQKIEWKM